MVESVTGNTGPQTDEQAKWVYDHYSSRLRLLWLHWEELGSEISLDALHERVAAIRAERPELEGTTAFIDASEDVYGDNELTVTFYRPLTCEEWKMQKAQADLRRAQPLTYGYDWNVTRAEV